MAGTLRRYLGITIITPKSCTNRLTSRLAGGKHDARHTYRDDSFNLESIDDAEFNDTLDDGSVDVYGDDDTFNKGHFDMVGDVGESSIRFMIV